MKKTIKTIAYALSAVMAVTAVPTVGCSAYNYPDSTYAYIAAPKVDVNFVILEYKEKDGELTITGCYDYDPEFCVNPFKGGYIAVCVFNGVLEIPSHIDDKLIVDIQSLSGNDTFHTIIVPDAITKILRTAFAGQNYTVDTADDELRLKTLYI